MSVSESGLGQKARVPLPGAAALPAVAAHGLLICEHCDTVHRSCPLHGRGVLRCVRCGAVLARYHWLGMQGMLALVLTALIAFAVGNLWPIIGLGLGAEHVRATLWGTIVTMWQQHAQVVAVLTAATLFVFPLNKMLMLGWVLSFASRGRRAPGFRPIMVTLHYLQPWTMTEVFVLGALVSIVKARAYFDVMPEAGIFAYAALTVLITIFSQIDLRRLWDATEPAP